MMRNKNKKNNWKKNELYKKEEDRKQLGTLSENMK